MLTRDQVIAVYRQVLERTPSDEEIDYQLGAQTSLEGMLRVALDSDEYDTRLRARRGVSARVPTVVNVFHPDLAPWGLQPGTRSGDEIAIVGHEGWLFLCGGTNANLGQYVGEVEMEPNWLGEWQQTFSRRDAELREMGLANAFLVVPDKLAVYEQHYPEDLTPVGPRPIKRLLAADLPIVYPLAELQAAVAVGEDVYMRTDTHLTFRGNAVLFASVREALGGEHQDDLAALPLHSYPATGDLGAKFEPPIVSIISEPASLHQARIVEDNRDQIAAVDGHIGTRRVFRNERARDPRVAVVFGDSFGFAAPNYQGLAWFMAQAFREVHFVWIPFGWDGDYVRRVGAEAVLIQGAERFVARVPHADVDTSRLAEETLRRKQPVGVEQIFD